MAHRLARQAEADLDFRPGLRSFAVGAYLVIYRVDDTDVLILRILRGNRDLPAL
jgi:plasmid stabilization system protein ParE